MKWLILVNTASTLVMVGIILTMQLVHYPLFNMVGTPQFPAYEIAHMGRISLLVIPFMLAEAFTALALALNPPPSVASGWLWLGLGLVAFIWLWTFLLQDTQHGTLAQGFNESVYQELVETNWARTAAWSARGILMCGVIWRLLG